MTYQPTTADYEAVITDFYNEMAVADQERMIEIQEVINVLREEQAKRGL